MTGSKFYVHNGKNLLYVGECQEGLECMQGGVGEISEAGEPPETLSFLPPPAPTASEQRARAYPSVTEFLDAQVKISSNDKQTQAEGQAQLSRYFAKCLSVKEQFPKE